MNNSIHEATVTLRSKRKSEPTASEITTSHKKIRKYSATTPKLAPTIDLVSKRTQLKELSKKKFQLGDLVWSKLGGFPWWPGIVANHPTTLTHIKPGTKYNCRICVTFLGPSSEYAWVPESSVISYNGIEAFKSHAQTQVNTGKTKSLREKIAERYQLKVAHSYSDQWEQAVFEADQAETMSVRQRFATFISSTKKNNDLSKFMDLTTKPSQENEKNSTKDDNNNHKDIEEEVVYFIHKRIQAMILIDSNILGLAKISDKLEVKQSIIMKDYLGIDDFRPNDRNENDLTIDESLEKKDIGDLKSRDDFFYKLEIARMELIRVLKIYYSEKLINPTEDTDAQEPRAIISLKLQQPMIFISLLHKKLLYNKTILNEMEENPANFSLQIKQTFMELYELKNELLSSRYSLEKFNEILNRNNEL